MRYFIGSDFNKIYAEICNGLMTAPEYKTKSRNNEKLFEFTNATIELTNIDNMYAFCRDLNFYYLAGELIFYLEGENKLENIVKYSKFWNTVSDDGVTVNSCYGYYIWKQKTANKLSQFDYCIKQLVNNPESKKAVITIYNSEDHSKKSEDNPCTMFLQFYIRDNKLFLKTVMRSNDIYFGLPYDLPFFCILQKMMYFELLAHYPKLKLGSYIHTANSLHAYEKDFEILKTVPDNYKQGKYKRIIPIFDKLAYDERHYIMQRSYYINKQLPEFDFIKTLFENKFSHFILNALQNFKIFKELEQISKKSTCLKKQVSCVFIDSIGLVVTGYSGRPDAMSKCKECVRDKEVFYQDGCNSLHSEERAILTAAYNGDISRLKGSICFLTHAPCDQCLKFLIYVGVKKVIFNKPYKTDFTRYKGYIEIEDGYGKRYV